MERHIAAQANRKTANPKSLQMYETVFAYRAGGKKNSIIIALREWHGICPTIWRTKFELWNRTEWYGGGFNEE